MALEIEGSNPFAHPIFVIIGILCGNRINMPENFVGLRKILREGELNGDGWVLELETGSNRPVFAVAVKREASSRTGPTWSYIFENDGWTSIDLGAPGSMSDFCDGCSVVGIEPKDIKRSIITHGHSDHDGIAKEVSDRWGIEIWAHEAYEYLKNFKVSELQDLTSSDIQRSLKQIMNTHNTPEHLKPSIQHEEYYAKRRALSVACSLSDLTSHADVEIMWTPGHSPDEICVLLDDFLFTGDHVLPEITPHPTTKCDLNKNLAGNLPKCLITTDDAYGLGTYLTSLGKVIQLGEKYNVMPAHRLYNKGNFNFLTVDRAQEIVTHHGKRLSRIFNYLGKGSSTLEEMTRGIFERSKLLGGNVFAAMSEIVAHIEYLEDTGDISVGQNGEIYKLHGGEPFFQTKLESIKTPFN